MLFIPEPKKRKKNQKGRAFNRIGSTARKHFLKQGQVGLRLISSCKIRSRWLTILHFIIRKKMKKLGHTFFITFPQITVTSKPLEIRMGKGKGNVNFWITKLKSGFIICEVSTLNLYAAIQILERISFRLPFRTKLEVQPFISIT
jgi:large subunit ribosomal protein L16